MGKKRIVDLPVRTSPSGGYVPIDGDTGTGKYNLEGITGMIAAEYDPDHTYPSGDYCIYEGDLYRAKSKTTPGDFVPSKWTRIIVSDELRAHKNLINSHTSDINGLHDDIAETNERIDDIELQLSKTKKFGVSGVGLAATSLTRLWDAVGMVAQVGTDGSNYGIINNFDKVLPFARKKCVGRWSNDNSGHPVFTVNAYYGDDNYTEDGSRGDYVAVECPLAYYYYDAENGVLGVSATKQSDDWKPFDIFTIGHDPDNTIPYYYAPAYTLAVDDNGHAVSLPGLPPAYGTFNDLLTAARSYANTGSGALATLEPYALVFYEWALFTVEFATTNCQSIMSGHVSNEFDAAQHQFFGATDAIITQIVHTNTPPVEGLYIRIYNTTIGANGSATHRVTDVTRCTQDGIPSPTGNYVLLGLEQLDHSIVYDLSTSYYVTGCPYYTGSCNNVGTPSGSPVSNTDGQHPMRYRYRENVWGDMQRTSGDLFGIVQYQEGSSDLLEMLYYWFEHPETYRSSGWSAPSQSEITTYGTKLDPKIDFSKFSGMYPWVDTRDGDATHPDLVVPTPTGNGSSTTYYSDEMRLSWVRNERSLRIGGNYADGDAAGLCAINAYSQPRNASLYDGSLLCFPQGMV